MPKRLFRKYLPSPESVRQHRSLGFLRHVLGNPNLWHINRHSLAAAAFVGVFVALLPIPMQMAVAALLAIRFQANLPLSVVLVWLTNPLTWVPVFFLTYRIGAWVLGLPVAPPENVSVNWMLRQLGPLWVGSVLSGLVLGWLSYWLVKVTWRISVGRRWERRRRRRQQDVSRPS